jgi:hypothetical protein
MSLPLTALAVLIAPKAIMTRDETTPDGKARFPPFQFLGFNEACPTVSIPLDAAGLPNLNEIPFQLATHLRP